MVKKKRLAASAMAATLMFGTYAPAWAGPSQSVTVSPQIAVAPANDEGSLSGIFGSIVTDRVAHAPAKQCRPGSMYSQHDVVGDPESCFINRLGIPSGGAGSGGFSGGIL